MEKDLLEAVLKSEGQIHVTLGNFRMSLSRFAEQLLHTIRVMACQTYRSIRQDLHPLITAQGFEVTQVQLKTAVFRRDNLRDLIAVRVPTIRCKAHDFAFVAVLRIADEFANHGIDAAERVRKEYAV